MHTNVYTNVCACTYLIQTLFVINNSTESLRQQIRYTMTKSEIVIPRILQVLTIRRSKALTIKIKQYHDYQPTYYSDRGQRLSLRRIGRGDLFICMYEEI